MASRTPHNRYEESTRFSRLKTKLTTIEMFTFVGCILYHNTTMFYYALSGSVTSIQRQFHLDSSSIGRLFMASELGPLGGLLLFSHFANRGNMSVITGLFAIVYAIGAVLFTLPQYIYRGDGHSSDTGNHSLLCNMSHGHNGSLSTVGDQEPVESDSAAFGIMFASLFLVGTCFYPMFTLPFSYLEENAKKSRAGLYIALLQVAWAMAPVMGLLLAAWATSQYVDLTSTSLNPEDPAWIGAWWLALLITAGLSLIPTPFLFCFPKTMKKPTTPSPRYKDEDSDLAVPSLSTSTEELHLQNAKQKEKEAKKEMYSWKGFFSSILRLLKNPVYLFSIFGYLFWAQFSWGFQSFFPKFYQEIYSLTAWEASIAAGIVSGIGLSLGRLSAGLIVTCLKVKLRMTLLIIIVLTGLTSFLLIGCAFVGCDNPDLVGTPTDGSQFIVDQPCASGCDCSGIPYSPVCDSGLTYFSPCHAGCLDTNTTTENGRSFYLHCNCTVTGTAVGGVCKKECSMFIPYTAMAFIMFLMVAFTTPLITIFILRCVEPEDKTLAFGLSMFIVGLLGWLPAASLFGSLIDTTCSVWEDRGGGVRGSCWVYDLVALTRRLHGLGAGQRFMQFVCHVVAYILARKKFDVWDVQHQD